MVKNRDFSAAWNTLYYSVRHEISRVTSPQGLHGIKCSVKRRDVLLSAIEKKKKLSTSRSSQGESSEKRNFYMFTLYFSANSKSHESIYVFLFPRIPSTLIVNCTIDTKLLKKSWWHLVATFSIKWDLHNSSYVEANLERYALKAVVGDTPLYTCIIFTGLTCHTRRVKRFVF